MTPFAPFPSRARRIGLIAAACFVVAGAPAADAQGFGWFGRLFGGGSPRTTPGAPSYPGYNPGYAPPGSSPSDDRPRRLTRRHRDPPVREVKERQPKNASAFVYVFGDTMGQMLATGLDDALGDRPDVGVLHRARAGTGLDDPASFDWLKTVTEALDGGATRDASGATAGTDGGGSAKTGDRKTSGRIDVGVVMIGANDRAPITEGGKVLEFGSPEWTAAYRKRVAAIDDLFKRKRVPLIWVGLPIAKDDAMADDLAALNDIYRDAALKDGMTYVDTWEAFSDNDGDFSASGPDIDGQTVRLRAADGVNFTKAGARKLAHFVEAHVRRALDGKVGPPDAGSPTQGAPHETPKAAAGVVENLSETPRATGGDLLPIVKSTAGRPATRAGADTGSATASPSGTAVAGPAPAPMAGSTTMSNPGPAPGVPAQRADNPTWNPDSQP